MKVWPSHTSARVELLEPGMGRVMGSIPDVNFIEGLDQMATEETIGEMLNQIDPTYNESRESNTSNKIGVDNNHCSTGKEKKGKEHPQPSPASKVEKKQQKEEERRWEEERKRIEEEERKKKDKQKPAPKSGLGSGKSRNKDSPSAAKKDKVFPRGGANAAQPEH